MAFDFKTAGKWALIALRALGLAAKAASEVAPEFSKNQKDLDKINKAAMAGEAAGKFADEIDRASKD